MDRQMNEMRGVCMRLFDAGVFMSFALMLTSTVVPAAMVMISAHSVTYRDPGLLGEFLAIKEVGVVHSFTAWVFAIHLLMTACYLLVRRTRCLPSNVTNGLAMAIASLLTVTNLPAFLGMWYLVEAVPAVLSPSWMAKFALQYSFAAAKDDAAALGDATASMVSYTCFIVAVAWIMPFVLYLSAFAKRSKAVRLDQVA